MRNLQSAVVKAVLAVSLVAGASPVGAVGSKSYTASQTALASVSQIEQTLYTAITNRQAIVEFKYQGNVKQFETLLEKALTAALNRDSYMRYIIERYNYSWRGSSSVVKVNVSFVYRESKEQTAYVDKRVKAIASVIFKPGMNAHEKVKAVHDWVVTGLQYDQSLQKYTAYEALTSGEAVCQGYALLTYKLLKAGGVDNRIVEGTAGGQPHAWNLLKLQNQWYHLDTTWDDPVPDQGTHVSYTYYLRTDAQLKADHSWTQVYPAAAESYFKTLEDLKASDKGKLAVYEAIEQELGYDLYLPGNSVNDSEGLKQKTSEAIRLGKHSATLRYAGPQSSLLQDLSRLYDLRINNITYASGPLEGTDDLKVTIEWTD